MKTANIRLTIDKFGSDLPKGGVTPAELLILCAIHMPMVQDYPIADVVETAEVSRTPIEEYKRLRRQYGERVVKDCFPGRIPQLPQTFEEAEQIAKDVMQTEEGREPSSPFFGDAATFGDTAIHDKMAVAAGVNPLAGHRIATVTDH